MYVNCPRQAARRMKADLLPRTERDLALGLQALVPLTATCHNRVFPRSTHERRTHFYLRARPAAIRAGVTCGMVVRARRPFHLHVPVPRGSARRARPRGRPGGLLR